MSAADKLAQVLAEHQMSGGNFRVAGKWMLRCKCGEYISEADGNVQQQDLAFGQHQSAAARAHLTAEAEAEAAEARSRMREDAKRSLVTSQNVVSLYEADSAAQWLRRYAQ